MSEHQFPTSADEFNISKSRRKHNACGEMEISTVNIKKFFSFFTGLFSFCTCIHMWTCSTCMWRLEKGIRCPKTVIGGCCGHLRKGSWTLSCLFCTFFNILSSKKKKNRSLYFSVCSRPMKTHNLACESSDYIPSLLSSFAQLRYKFKLWNNKIAKFMGKNLKQDIL